MLVVALVMLATAGLVAVSSSPRAAAAPGPEVTGIDTSKWQHPTGQPIDWTAVRASGVSFAFIKASEGPNPIGGPETTDPWFERDWAAAGAAGLYRGAYHRARPSLPVTNAVDDARWFVSVTGAMAGARDLPPVLDLESSGGLSPADLADWTANWLLEVTRMTGRRPMIYTGYDFWQTAMAGTFRFAGYPLWYARWVPDPAPTPLLPAWPRWTFWQYGQGTVPGVTGATVDLDRFCCTLDDLRTYTGTSTGAPAVATNADGRLETFSTDPSGVVSHTWQLAPNSPWSGWIDLDRGQLIGQPTVVANADGRLEVFGVALDGRVLHEWQLAPNSPWSGWAALGSSPAADTQVVPVRNADGRLELFARGPSGDLLHTWQVQAGSGWSGWASLGGQLASTPTAIVDGTGRVNVVAEATDRTLAHIRQSAPGAGWGSWANRGGSIDGRPAALVAPSNHLTVFASSGSGIATVAEVRTNGAWGSWRTLAGSFTPGVVPVAGRNADGRLEVFATGPDGVLVHRWQVQATDASAWSAWAGLAGGLTDADTLASNADGRLEVFSENRANIVLHLWQLAPNGGWTPAIAL